MYEGRTGLEAGKILGHESMGEVVEVGAGVDRVRVGDQVSLPFNIGCGFCANCERGNTGFCLTVNPGTAGGAYGFYGMGPYAGGQAELLRVPYGDFNCLVMPEDAAEKQNDYTMLSDIFPTGWHATELAGMRPGESVAVYGGGPVGIMAAYSAVLRGASQVFVVDRHPDRLELAEKAGAIPIDDSQGDPAQQILDAADGVGADRGLDEGAPQAGRLNGEPRDTAHRRARSGRSARNPSKVTVPSAWSGHVFAPVRKARASAPGARIGTTGRRRPVARSQVRASSSMPRTCGPPRSGTRPAGADAASSTSRAATSRTSTGWKEVPASTGRSPVRARTPNRPPSRSWNCVARRIVHGTPDPASTVSTASFSRW